MWDLERVACGTVRAFEVHRFPMFMYAIIILKHSYISNFAGVNKGLLVFAFYGC